VQTLPFGAVSLLALPAGGQQQRYRPAGADHQGSGGTDADTAIAPVIVLA
jgi:hypothetical protein